MILSGLINLAEALIALQQYDDALANLREALQLQAHWYLPAPDRPLPTIEQIVAELAA